MAKIAKSDVVEGLLCASASYPEVLVLGWANKARGLARVRVVRAQPGSAREGWELTIPYQSLRW